MNPNRLRRYSTAKSKRMAAAARPHYSAVWRTAPGSIAAKVISQLLAAAPPR